MSHPVFDAAAVDATTPESLREVGSMKWTLFGEKTPAFVAEMDFGIAPVITEALHAAVENGAFGYLPPATRDAMTQATAAWEAERYGWQVSADDVKPLPDVISVLKLAIDHFSAPDSAVIVPTPGYMPFLSVPLAHGRRIIEVPMLRTEDGWEYDLDGLDRAFADGGGLLILCNPHNPIGRVLQRPEMEAISEIVDRHSGRVFSDEIHAPLVYPGGQHIPYASVNDVAASHTLTAVSASKAWNLPGLKAAQAILSNDADRDYWAKNGRSFGHEAANLGVVAHTAAYTGGKEWLDGALAYLDGNRRYLGELLAEHLPGARYTAPEGTYLAWIDCDELGIDGSPSAFFAKNADVVTTDGAQCGTGNENAIRFNFATPRPILEQSIAAMGAAWSASRPAA